MFVCVRVDARRSLIVCFNNVQVASRHCEREEGDPLKTKKKKIRKRRVAWSPSHSPLVPPFPGCVCFLLPPFSLFLPSPFALLTFLSVSSCCCSDSCVRVSVHLCDCAGVLCESKGRLLPPHLCPSLVLFRAFLPTRCRFFYKWPRFHLIGARVHRVLCV